MAEVTRKLHGRASTIDQIARLVAPPAQTGEFHCWGVVRSVNPDGSYQVQLNDSDVSTRCAACVSAAAGARVLVLVMQNGQCVAIAKRI